MLAACGGPQALESDLPDAAASQPLPQSPPPPAACDYCPGAPATHLTVFSDATYESCDCPGGQPGLYFKIEPPLGSCAHIQCMYAYVVAHGCQLALDKDADGNVILPDCPP